MTFRCLREHTTVIGLRGPILTKVSKAHFLEFIYDRPYVYGAYAMVEFYDEEVDGVSVHY